MNSKEPIPISQITPYDAGLLAAMEYILPNEGGFSNRPADRGGPTNMGISLKFLQSTGLRYDFDDNGVVDIREIKNLTTPQAFEIYENEFWLPNNLGSIHDYKVSTKIFDALIISSPRLIIKYVQSSINKIVNKTYLKVDGIMGNLTVMAINSLLPISEYPDFFKLFSDKLISYYRTIVANDPSQSENLRGWINRSEKIP